MEKVADSVRELYAFEEELYHYNLDENGYLAKLDEMVCFIYDNFQEPYTLNLYYSYQFEIELAKKTDVIFHIYHLPKNPLKKSVKLKTYLLNLATEPKYKNARADFLKAIANIWIKDFIKITLTDELWHSDLIQLELFYLLNQKRIGGFGDRAMQVLALETDPKSELSKIATRYLNNEPKFKHYSLRV